MSAVQSALFEPVLWQDRGFKILDEIQVPQKIHYIEVTEVAQALAAVHDMKTRAFGQVLTFFYSAALVAENYHQSEAVTLRTQLRQMTQQFCDARPTFDFRGLGAIVDGFFDHLPAGADAGATIAAQTRARGQQIVRGRDGRAARAAALLPNPTRLLTHCNVSGELVAVAAYCQELGKEFSVIATETRPYLQGARLTAWELAQAGVKVSVIPDGAVAAVLAQGEVNAVIVGADRVAQNGDVINKVGTYPLARMAREYGVPFYALVQDPRSLARGADVPIEERPAAELLTFHDRQLVPGAQGTLQARYPSFDVTPAQYITQLIGFDGVYTPESFRQKYQTGAPADAIAINGKGKYLLLYGVPPANQFSFLLSALKAEGAEAILVPEMRPQLWGAQLVVPELLKRGVSTTIISDNMIGTLFAQGEIAKLCFFYDGLEAAGPLAICGSLLAVQLARLHGVAIELFNGSEDKGTSLDIDAATFLGESICPAGVTVRAVGAELVPWGLLKG